MPYRKRLAATTRRASLELRSLRILLRSGVIGGDKPSTLRQVGAAVKDYGAFGATSRIAAIKHGSAAAIADERGEVTYAELDEIVNRLANAFLAVLAPGDTVGILCRNHRGPLLVGWAAGRAGLNHVWMNTSFSAPQATEVATREGVDLLVYDADLADLVSGIQPRHGKYAVDIDQSTDELDKLVASGAPTLPTPPPKPGKMVLLTSGTTGTPKGALRAEAKGLIPPAAMLDRLPMRPREVTLIAPPLFHGTGLGIAMLAVSLGNKLVLRRKFDAATLLRDIEQHRVNTVCLVPIMLQRVLALGDDEIRRHDTSSLKILFSAGSQLPTKVAEAARRLFGEVVHNLYGSTEVAIVSIATPTDVREAPTSVGQPCLGTTVKIFDEQGEPVPTGQTGRIFVSGFVPFEGYTGGGGKQIIDGLLSSGDVGHIGPDGRIYIDGRDDDMIVSGAENVFPREVEEVLTSHAAIVEASVIGVDDEEWGKRLRAFVVLATGATLTEDELKTHVKANLARYKVPRDVVFLDALPRNATGKVLKRELATWSPL